MSALILQFPVMGKFLNRIKELRLRADMSQQELADLAGCSKMHISKTERGDTRLDIHWMAQISAALGVAPGDLLLHSDNLNAAYSDDERQLLALYRGAADETKAQMLAVADTLAGFEYQPHVEDAA